MNYDCELIQDLLPLYEEGLCSPASRRAVEEHLRLCEACRRLSAPLPIEEPQDLPAADRAVKKGIKKVKRRWLTSLIAAVLVVPLLLLSVNQFRGRGVCFTNPDDIVTAWQFLHALETENWEKAAAMHDYSGDYESILEALNMEISAWGTPFTPCDPAGYDFVARRYLELAGHLPRTLGDLYSYLYNRHGTAMVPMELWEQLMAIDPSAFQQNGWQYWLNGELYGKITTDWGEFVVSEGRGYDTAYDYASCFDLIPAAIYEEAKPELEAEAQRLYAETHAAYGYVADMTEAEFLDYMAKSYAADLEEVSEQVSFDCTGYQGAYLLWENDGWHIQFGVTLTYQSKTLDTIMAFGVEDGSVHLVSLSHREQADWLDSLERALYPSAHPKY